MDLALTHTQIKTRKTRSTSESGVKAVVLGRRSVALKTTARPLTKSHVNWLNQLLFTDLYEHAWNRRAVLGINRIYARFTQEWPQDQIQVSGDDDNAAYRRQVFLHKEQIRRACYRLAISALHDRPDDILLWDIFSSPITQDEYEGRSLRVLTNDAFEAARSMQFMGPTAAAEHMLHVTPDSHRQTVDDALYKGQDFLLRKLCKDPLMTAAEVAFILSEIDRVTRRRSS
ncbi:hypothetical protein VNI00_017289 [Paramarasmius palmivorus]|uniref:Uncharacterized protein n=1 Tax=Paramarasmius palmivorus TaxID=297713 RepID=A0AAW0B7C5_9AGAR